MTLAGLKVVEFAGLAPGPFAGLVLADNGASVIRIDRPSSSSTDILCRGKRSLAIDMKIPSGQRVVKTLMSSADVVIDPFRPGVMEKLGLGPDIFLCPRNASGMTGLNDRLIYARIAGFSRTGPHKDMAGHDINYLALSGVLSMLPGPEKPTFPLNLVADFAGGGLACATGILLALIERGKSGRGQIVDVDMVSGTRYLASFPLIHTYFSSPSFDRERGHNMLDGGAPFYDVYTCKDGGWISVGCLEPRFFKIFLEKLLSALPKAFFVDIGDWRPTTSSQTNRKEWPRMRTFLEKGFATNTRAYWENIFHGTDACVVPVLTAGEVAILDASQSPFPLPHPRVLSRTPSALTDRPFDGPFLSPGQHTEEILREMGVGPEEQEILAREGVLGAETQAKAKL